MFHPLQDVIQMGCIKKSTWLKGKLSHFQGGIVWRFHREVSFWCFRLSICPVLLSSSPVHLLSAGSQTESPEPCLENLMIECPSGRLAKGTEGEASSRWPQTGEEGIHESLAGGCAHVHTLWVRLISAMVH